MTLIAALDVAYGEERGVAVAACVRAADFRAAEPLDVTLETVLGAAEYEPGAFYKRELPALLAVLAAAPKAEILIVDGYVWLDGAGKPGLGARLFEAIEGRAAVIGVAKSPLKEDAGATAFSEPVRRGRSAQPLRVTSVGVERATAAARIAEMAGDGRAPMLLRAADGAARAELARILSETG